MNDAQGHNRNGPGLSRRQFLKGSSAAAAAVTALGTPPYALADLENRSDSVGMGCHRPKTRSHRDHPLLKPVRRPA